MNYFFSDKQKRLALGGLMLGGAAALLWLAYKQEEEGRDILAEGRGYRELIGDNGPERIDLR